MKAGWIGAAVLSGSVLLASPVLYLRTLLKTSRHWAADRLGDPQPAYYGPPPAPMYGPPLPPPVYDQEPGPPAYGVPHCGSDDECARLHGPGWYCAPGITRCAPRPSGATR